MFHSNMKQGQHVAQNSCTTYVRNLTQGQHENVRRFIVTVKMNKVELAI